MGCVRSAPGVAPAGPAGPACKGDVAPSALQPAPVSREVFESGFRQILGAAHTVSCPPGAVPVACLTGAAVPIVLSSLSIDAVRDASEVLLPLIAIAPLALGRIAAYGHISLLDRAHFEAGETSSVVINSLKWLAHARTALSRLVFLGVPQQFHPAIRVCLDLEAISANFAETDAAVENERVLAVGTTLDVRAHGRFLQDFLAHGGGLAVFCVDHDSALAFNDFLTQYGIGVPCCCFSEDREPAQIIATIPQYEVAMQWGLPSMAERLAQIAASPAPNEFAFDSLVTAIGYCLRIPEFRNLELVRQLKECTWSYLRRNGYRTEDGLIGPKIPHAIAILLLHTLWQKEPLDVEGPHPDADSFPGVSTAETLEECLLPLEIRDNRLISTGMWLNAGVCGTVECLDCPPGIFVQIGSHMRSLVFTPRPWHRWPSVCTCFALQSPSTTVLSPFGGIVYILALSVPPMTLELKFKNFSKFPMADLEHPDGYRPTKSCPAPWAELISPFVILTLPSSALEEIENLTAIRNFLRLYVTTLASAICYTIERPYRLVFDVDGPIEMDAGYPAVLLISDIPDILTMGPEPTASLFRALMLFALSSFQEGLFDPDTERALAYFAVVITFCEIHPFFDPLENSLVEAPPLFAEIWHIHTHVSKTVLPELFRRSQLPTAVISQDPQERWLNFLKDLAEIAKVNFVPLFKERKLVPLSLEAELSKFKPPKA
jgi:hypothetical protein